MLVFDMILFGLNCQNEQNLQVPLRCFSHALNPLGFGAWHNLYQVKKTVLLVNEIEKKTDASCEH